MLSAELERYGKAGDNVTHACSMLKRSSTILTIKARAGQDALCRFGSAMVVASGLTGLLCSSLDNL